jgi:hypothetical protein
VVSHYIENPLTIDGLKFDLRIYAAVTNLNPLRIYVYNDGLVRFATEQYRRPTAESLNQYDSQFVHLTNYSINKNNKRAFVAGDETLGASGSKWSYKAWQKFIREKGINEPKLTARINDLVIKTIIASESALMHAF